MNTIETLHKELQALLPMKEADRQRYDQKFMLEFNYNSNHLEGNTLTYGQTKLLLIFDKTNGGDMKDYEEMKAHNTGLKMMKVEALNKERLLSERFIRDLNKIILVKNYWSTGQTLDGQLVPMEINVGVYKTRPNNVKVKSTEESFYFASPEETPAFMTALIDWYRIEEQKSELHPVELAALLHYRYIRIHPFEDGNGRIARLLVNYVLLRHGFPMLIIRTDDRKNYLQILNECDIQVGLSPNDGANATLEQIQPFVEYLKDQEIKSLELAIKAAKGENIEEDDDLDKKIILLKNKISAEKISKYPQIVYQVFTDFNNRIWNRIEEILLKFNDLFGEFKETHKVNRLEEIFENRKNGLYTLKHLDEVDTTPQIPKIFGHNIYEQDIRTVEWIFDFLGLKGADKSTNRNLSIKTKIEFSTDYYNIDIRMENDNILKKLSYNDTMLESDVKDMCKRISESVYAKIENEIKRK